MSDHIETSKVLDELTRQNGAAVAARPRPGRLATFLRVTIRLVLLLLLIMALALVAFLQWNLNTGFNRLSAENTALQEALQQAEARLASLEAGPDSPSGTPASQAQVEVLRDALEARLAVMNQDFAELQTRLPLSLEQQDGRWRIAEAHYLLRHASHHLTLTGDVPAAITLLETADSLLAGSGVARAAPARRALADELDRLRAAASSDPARLHQRLGGLRETLDTQRDSRPLQQILLDRLARESTGDQAGPLSSGSWLDSGLHTLRSIFIWRRWPAEPATTQAPDQLYVAYTRLGLLLEQAQLALLTRQRRVYLESLRTAAGLAERYPSLLGEAAGAFLAELESLGGEAVLPELPDLNDLATQVGELLPAADLRSPGPSR